MDRLRSLHREISEQDLNFLGSSQYVYHCHHFNLFHDQTVDDALGEVEGFRLKERAAHAASRQLLADVLDAAGAARPAERLELASTVFSFLGHGRLSFEVSATGGTVRGEFLHYGFSWREKYGSQVRRHHVIDAFAAGFAAAATELAFDLEPGTLEGRETECLACRGSACRIEISSRQGPRPEPVPRRPELLARLSTAETGLEEERISVVARQLKDFVLGIDPDQRGLVQGFGVYVTRHLTGYYNPTAFDTVHAVERDRPAMTGVVEALFAESGHVCVFYTLGNILLSPEWEGLFGAPSGDPAETLISCVAICRALGFGHWTVSELSAGERLVLRASSSYEAPFYLERYGVSEKARSYFLGSSALAMMRLAHSVDLPARPTFDADLYQSLFKGGLPWCSEITSCLTRGDAACEVVVEASGG
ncbi:MAG: hypothetical protein MI919_30900 [Holophagales bacterium]|nr:hypothetical protein [Holophagales bacterium]